MIGVDSKVWAKAQRLAKSQGRHDPAYVKTVYDLLAGHSPNIHVEDQNMIFRSLAMQDTFTVWVPGVVELGKEKLHKALDGIKVLQRYERPNFLQHATDRHLGGYASTEKLDRQQEQLLAKGLDFTENVLYGWYNDNHIQDTAGVVGVPCIAELHYHPDIGLKWYSEGYLLKDLKRADDIWSLAKSLHKVGLRLGFSVEGAIIDRDGPIVLKALIRNIAITANPVNVEASWSIIAKAMQGHPDYFKALLSGVPTASSGGGVLVGESLEGHEQRRVFDRDGDIFADLDGVLESERERAGKTVQKGYTWLSQDQAVRWILDKHPEYGEKLALDIVSYAHKYH